jgi:FHS family L-fucose permease-like MFS transporter
MSSENLQTKWGQFISLIIVFFFWGFVGSANDILIPFSKGFMLSQVQSQLVAWACSILCRINYFLLGIIKVDVLQKFGYKRHYLLVYYFLHLVLLCLFLQPQWRVFLSSLPLYLQ